MESFWHGKNVGQLPDAMVETLRDSLEKWKRLPESERAPGAVKVSVHGRVDTDYHRQLPSGGVIIKVFARALDRQVAAARTLFTDAQCTVGRGDEASRDHLWLTETEWRSLIPENSKAGTRAPVPANIAQRIMRFHLVDNTGGEPAFWRRDEIRSSQLDVIVQSVSAIQIELRLEGSALLATDADASRASRGYEPKLEGHIKYDRQQRRLTQFDVVAVGDHWGAGRFTRRSERPGRAPLGVAFELASGQNPTDRIAPQGARELRDYFGR